MTLIDRLKGGIRQFEDQTGHKVVMIITNFDTKLSDVEGVPVTFDDSSPYDIMFLDKSAARNYINALEFFIAEKKGTVH